MNRSAECFETKLNHEHYEIDLKFIDSILHFIDRSIPQNQKNRYQFFRRPVNGRGHQKANEKS